MWLGGKLNKSNPTSRFPPGTTRPLEAAQARVKVFGALKSRWGSLKKAYPVRAANRASPQARLLLDGNQGLTERST